MLAMQNDLFEYTKTQSLPPPDGIPPDVAADFERLALHVIGRGFRRYSSDAILHQLRWEHHIERGAREFKLNDHWTAPLARWFMARHPEHGKFFETRERRA
jgi:hypothetical protein